MKKKKTSRSKKHEKYVELYKKRKKWIDEHKDVFCKWRSAYYFANKQKYQEIMKEYYEKNADEIRKKTRAYRAAHKDEYNKWHLEYQREYRRGIRRNKDGKHGNLRYGPGDSKLRMGTLPDGKQDI